MADHSHLDEHCISSLLLLFDILNNRIKSVQCFQWNMAENPMPVPVVLPFWHGRLANFATVGQQMTAWTARVKATTAG
jgi:uncharacterized integral membrane protein